MLTNSTNAYLKQGDELLNHDVLSKLWKTIVNLWHNIVFAHAMSGALLIPGTKKGIKNVIIHTSSCRDTNIWIILKQAIFHSKIIHTDSSSSKSTKKHKVLQKLSTRSHAELVKYWHLVRTPWHHFLTLNVQGPASSWLPYFNGFHAFVKI